MSKQKQADSVEIVLDAGNKRFDKIKDKHSWREEHRIHYLFGWVKGAYSVLERKYNDQLKK